MNEKSKEREALTHELKCDRGPFQDILSGSKKAEVRRDDRDFRVGDRLNLLETVNTAEQMRAGAPLEYTGGQDLKRITHVQRGYGLPDGIVVLSFDDDHSEHARHMVAGAAAGALAEAKADQQADRRYRAAFIAGWNAGVMGDEATLKRVQDRAGPLSAYLAAQPAADAPKPAPTKPQVKLSGDEARAIVRAAHPGGSDHPSGIDYVRATVDYLNRHAALQWLSLLAPAPDDRQGVALSDEEIERTFYPSGSATPNQLLIARSIGRAIERMTLSRADAQSGGKSKCRPLEAFATVAEWAAQAGGEQVAWQEPIYQWRDPSYQKEGWNDCDVAKYEEVAQTIAANPRRTWLQCRIVYAAPASSVSPAELTAAVELPPMPSNVAHITRRVRRCESDAPAQLVIEHFAREYARSALLAAQPAAAGALTEHDAESLRMIAGWMDQDGIPEAAKLLRRLAAQPAADAPETTAQADWPSPFCEKCGGAECVGLACLTTQDINKMMADAGWQNSATRNVDLPKVEKVVRTALALAQQSAAPAEPARADRQEWMGPVVIDRSHPNQAYVTYGFDDEAQCTQFIKATRYGSPVDRQGVALSDADLAKELWAEICELPDRYWSESEKEACISNFSEFLGCVERVMERRAISHASSSQGVALSDAVRAVKQLCNEIKQSLDIIDKRHGVCGATEAIHEKADAIVSVLDSRASSSRAEVEIPDGECPADDKWNCKYCKQIKQCDLHSENAGHAIVPKSPRDEAQENGNG